MTGLDLLLAVAGVTVTVLVVVGMILITPRGQVESGTEERAPLDTGTADGAGLTAGPLPIAALASEAPPAPVSDPAIMVNGAKLESR